MKDLLAGKLRTICVSLLLLSLLLTPQPDAAQSSTVQSQSQRPTAAQMAQGDFVPGEVLVGLRSVEGVSAAALTNLLALQGAEVVETLDLRTSADDSSLSGYKLRVPAGQEWATIEQLLQEPAVAFAEPNGLVQAAQEIFPAEKAQSEQPYAINDPFYVEKQWYLQRVNASRALALAYDAEGFAGNFTSVQVAIVDSGVEFTHTDLIGQLLPGYDYLEPGTKPTDSCGHGTHIAGLVGASLNNAIGIASLTPLIQLDPRRVLSNTCGGSIDNVARGIREAADAGAKIINLSLTTPTSFFTLESAVKYAASKGILLIAAAGNAYPSPVYYPAAYPEVMAVAALSYDDKHASYSNVGTDVEIAAPGGERNKSIYSSIPKALGCRDISPQLPHNGYCTKEGTSMAAAIVSGAAALIMSVRPDLTADQVRKLLKDTAVPVAESATRSGAGRVDVEAALRRLLPTTLKLTDNFTFLCEKKSNVPASDISNQK